MVHYISCQELFLLQLLLILYRSEGLLRVSYTKEYGEITGALPARIVESQKEELYYMFHDINIVREGSDENMLGFITT